MPRIKGRLEEELNKQLNSELYSAYLYLSMAAYFDSMNLRGFASWMKVQAKEELEHAMKIYEYINDRGGRVKLDAIKAPPTQWSSVSEAIEHALRHEESVTESIGRLYRLAKELGDEATEVFLHWFINEQVEEEALFSDLLNKVKAAGEDPRALLMLDSVLAGRK